VRHRFIFLFAPLVAVAAVVACSAAPQQMQFTGGSKTQSGSGASTSGGGSGQTGGASNSGTGGSNFLFDGGEAGPPCTGLQCQAQLDNCAAKGLQQTSISGRVYDPAGQLPLYNVYVYIPNQTPDPILTGNPMCTQCEAPASGSPVIGALTDAHGIFSLTQGAMDTWGVPSGQNIPLVLQVGKWRRQLTIPMVKPCASNPLPDNAATRLRLPAKSSEGDMPLIAFTSGCDPAECFLRHIGIDDSEFVPPGSAGGHVHFYTGQDASGLSGNASQIAGGNTWTDTYTWWQNLANLQKYDIVFNACECSDYDRDPTGTAYKSMHDYLNGGGRLFTTHYYYNWFAPPTGPSDFQSVVNWALPESFSTQPYTSFYVDTTFPKGKAFADWLQGNAVTTTYGQINLADTRYDMNGTTPESTRWIYNADAMGSPTYATMYMSFNAPVAVPPTMQCGRAVYSDVHLSGSSDNSMFPMECANADPDMSHAINEKALEFLFFDLSSCVQDNSMPPPPPPPTK
jgi:hypothetical protein